MSLPPYQLALPGRDLAGRSFRRLALLDTGVLTNDIIAALRRREPSSLLRAMGAGTVRGFIAHHVWAEVPRVLDKRHRREGGFDLAAAHALWWTGYVPVIYTVCTDYLPISEQAAELAARDPSDGVLVVLGKFRSDIRNFPRTTRTP